MAVSQCTLAGARPEVWESTHRQDARIAAFADRHYSRQSHGSAQFAPPGEGVFLISEGAVWVVVRNRMGGVYRLRNTLFRREDGCPHTASALIAAAVCRTREVWAARYGAVPTEPLTTEVDPRRVRHKRDPGRCYLRAGWRVVGRTARGLVVLEAP